nr:hypothetical protein [Campylobacter sp.]
MKKFRFKFNKFGLNLIKFGSNLPSNLIKFAFFKPNKCQAIKPLTQMEFS